MAVFNGFFAILLLLIFVVVLMVAFFLWINRRDINQEEKSYEDKFCHHDNISHRYRHADPTVEPDPVESLKKYRVDDE